MKKAVAAILFAVLLLTACGQPETTIIEGVFIEGVEIKGGLMLADLMDAGWKYDAAVHDDPDFLQMPVSGGAEIEVKMILVSDSASVIIYCENKTEGRIILSDCPISRFEIYPGDIGDNMTLPGGVTFGDNKSEIKSKLGDPSIESDYAIRYDNIPGIKDLTFVMKDDQKTLHRIDIFI